ncbi:MAG: hypothetical protein ABFD69_13595 [Candidatus Sumerlaeia bacterium]
MTTEPTPFAKPSSNRNWYLLWVALVGVKLVLAHFHPEPAASDEGTYMTVARRLLDHGAYMRIDYMKPTAGIMPGYPLLVAAVLKLGGGSIAPMYYINALLSLAIAWASGALLFLMAGNRLLSRWCMVVVYLFPPIVTYAWHPLTEIPYTAALMMMLYSWEKTRRRPLGVWNWFFLGLFTVVSFMIRPVMFLLTPLFFAWPLVVARLHWRAIAGAAVGTAVVLMLWLPWVYRNYKVFHGFVPLATTTGLAFFSGTLPDWSKWFEEQQAEMKRSGISDATHDELAVSRHFAAAAQKNFERDKWGYYKRAIKNSWRLWPTAYSGRYFPKGTRQYVAEGNWLAVATKLTLGGMNLALLAGMACAVVILLGQPRWWPYILIIAYFHVMHAMIMPMPRYSMPLTPMIIVMIFGAAGHLWKRKMAAKEASAQ